MGRGAERLVPTTMATAVGRPSSARRRASGNTSLMDYIVAAV